MEKDQIFMAEGLNRTAAKPTWNSCSFGLEMQTNELNSVGNCFLNPNWDNSMDQSDPFESALSSMVCSPAASNAGSTNFPGSGENFMMRELLGKLGNICNNSGDFSPQSLIKPNSNTSCYNSPLNSPPNLNLAIMDSQIRGNQLLNAPPVPSARNSRLSRCSSPENGDSKENSSISEQIPGLDSSTKGQNDANSRKRKSVPRGKAKEIPSPVTANAKIAEENDESTSKRSKQQNGSAKAASKENSKPAEPPKDYIHVRARRGQATDSHSLAERVRREKISERMKILQDLVPGCNKVTGKAVMLDEIINYVQSLQHQVEFLSMKLATVNPKMNVNMEALLSKDMFRPRGSLPHGLYSMDSSVPAFGFGYQPQQGLPMNHGICNNTDIQFSMNPPNAALHKTQGLQLPPADGLTVTDANPQVGSYWDDDLQSIVQMGFGQN